MTPQCPPSPPASSIATDLWTDEQSKLATAVVTQIKQRKLELVRFSFADQHGVLRGKTLLAGEAASAMKSGVNMTTTLLAKDTAHKTVFPVFTAGGGFNMPEMQGGADFVMVPDPATFRVLPWAPNTGWLLCDIYFANGKPVPFSSRRLYREALVPACNRGLRFSRRPRSRISSVSGITNPRLAPEDATWPPAPPDVALLAQGYQLLTETRFDQIDAALDPIRKAVEALGLPLRSIESELGPSQVEFTFRTLGGMDAADAMVLFRSAAKQVARRNGCLASFMCRPALPNMMSSGWHLHQSLIEHKRKINAFALNDRDVLSTVGRYYLGGLIAHARAGAAFSTPTINGYKRYRPMSLAPDRAIWARDNRGVMVRVIGQPGDPATHLENRIGEPAANPYLYMASQIYAGLDGIARRLDPGPVSRCALRTFGGAVAEKSRRGADRADRRRGVTRRLRHAVRELLRAHQECGARALSEGERQGQGPGRADRMGAARILRHVLIAGTRTASRH